MRTIARDPFARTETVRQSVRLSLAATASCAWCGNPGRFLRSPQVPDERILYRYGTESDGGRRSIGERLFCSVGCWRDFNS